MCNPVSLIMSLDMCWAPAQDGWNHSHSVIAAKHGLPDGLMGDKYARVEVPPPDGRFRDEKTNAVLTDTSAWKVKFGVNGPGDRMPGWWKDDAAAQNDRARKMAERWLKSMPDHLVPGYRAQGGDDSTLTGGDGSTLTGGDGSTLIWRVWNESDGRYRIHILYPGEGGTVKHAAYRFKNGKAVKVKDAPAASTK